jgi:hypothetical protein
MLMTLCEAAEFMRYEAKINLRLDDGSKVLNPKRAGNRLWEKVRMRERLRKMGLPLTSLGIWADFPAEKVGRSWMVHRSKLNDWLNRHFGGRMVA